MGCINVWEVRNVLVYDSQSELSLTEVFDSFNTVIVKELDNGYEKILVNCEARVRKLWAS